MDETLTYDLFCQKFNNEETCINALFSARWPNGFSCPCCNHPYFYLIRSRKLPLFECTSCHVQTSLISGTVMEGSRTPLKLWFQAFFLHSTPQGISATRLASIIGTTYKTAWLICHKIRHAMSYTDSKEMLSGLVRVNWGVYGRPYNPTIYRHPQEQPLLAGGSFDNNNQITHLKIKQVPDEHLVYDRITPSGGLSFVSQHVDPAVSDISVVIQKFSRNREWSLIRSSAIASEWINTIFNGIGSKHLQSYLDQYCFTFNAVKRNSNTYETLVLLCATSPTIKYPTLISRVDNSAIHKRNYIGLLNTAG